MSGLMVWVQPDSRNSFSMEQNDHLRLDSPSTAVIGITVLILAFRVCSDIPMRVSGPTPVS